MDKTDVSGMTRAELGFYLQGLGCPAYRAEQVFGWIHGRAVYDFHEMTNLPITLRDMLETRARVVRAEIACRKDSAEAGVSKFLFRMADGCAVESVVMGQRYGGTICVSSQAGCRMGCVFCASAKGGMLRGLAPGEITAQVYEASKAYGRGGDFPAISNVVVMGTGEPFDNYDSVMKALYILNDKRGQNIGQRSMTISTCGIIDGILRFADEGCQINLAVSLHAPNDDIRARIMPVARKNPFDELLAACEYYQKSTRRRVSYEYALSPGVNDGPEHAAELARRVRGTLCHVNVMALNGGPEEDKKAANAAVAAFANVLKARGVPVSIRRGRGADIKAACGQLRHENNN